MVGIIGGLTRGHVEALNLIYRSWAVTRQTSKLHRWKFEDTDFLPFINSQEKKRKEPPAIHLLRKIFTIFLIVCH